MTRYHRCQQEPALQKQASATAPPVHLNKSKRRRYLSCANAHPASPLRSAVRGCRTTKIRVATPAPAAAASVLQQRILHQQTPFAVPSVPEGCSTTTSLATHYDSRGRQENAARSVLIEQASVLRGIAATTSTRVAILRTCEAMGGNEGLHRRGGRQVQRPAVQARLWRTPPPPLTRRHAAADALLRRESAAAPRPM